MTEKELTVQAGKQLDQRLAEAKKTGNLVVKDALEDACLLYTSRCV